MNIHDNFISTLTNSGNAYVYNPRSDVFSLRTFQDYSPQELNIIKLITGGKNILPVGSARFVAHSYPSDIDVLDNVNMCCTINSVRLNLASTIQRIIQSVISDPSIFLADFKAGYDDRYDFYLGTLYQGQVVDYDHLLVQRDLDNIYYQGLFTSDEWKIISSLNIPHPTEDQYITLYNKLRSFSVIRWNENEILTGYKELRGNKRLYLEDALISKSIVKMDLWAPIGNRYVEVTNFFIITLDTPQGRRTLTADFHDYVESLSRDIIEFRNDNPLKSAKRLWNLAYIFKDQDLLQKLAPLFSSPVSLLYQIRSDLDVIQSILNTIPNPPIDFLNLEINDIRSRIYQALSPVIPPPLELNNERITIDQMSETLTRLINEYTESYFRSSGIEPLEYIKHIDINDYDIECGPRFIV